MVGHRFLTAAAVALGVYGVLGLIIGGAMLVVGIATFTQLSDLQRTFDSQRGTLVQSLRTVSSTLHDTASATSGFQQSIDRARAAADQASSLANSSAGTFRNLGATMSGLTVLGIQPLAALGPQFNSSADQLQQLGMQLGNTRDALAQNGSDVQRVGNDLSQLQQQLDGVATSLSDPGFLALDARSLVPFEIAFYGMCLLVLLQSVFSLIAGIGLYRIARALRTEPLFPQLTTVRALETATTSDAAERGPAHVS
ncbi:MAG: hypothetical protein JO057_02315 [Chloroflexi bacterium]|nr:hypothetical protein [Chloroflexota bacterium]